MSFSFGRVGAKVSLRGVVFRRSGAYSIVLEGTRFDSRAIPCAVGSKAPWYFVLCPIEGELRVGQRRILPNDVVVLPQHFVTVKGSPAFPIRSLSNEAHAVALRVHPDDLATLHTEPRVHECSSATVTAIRELSTALSSDAFQEAAVHAQRAATCLVGEGITRQEPDSGGRTQVRASVVQRFARTVYPLLSELTTKPGLADVIEQAGVSERQFLRSMVRVQETFDLPDRGFRTAMVRWRATAAALLASSSALSLDEVAVLAGYASPNAVHRAFRKFELPFPGMIQKLAHEAPGGDLPREL